MKKDKGWFDLKQRQIQRSYREKVKKDHDHAFFLLFVG
ncbi:hypothetical protein QFZ31_001642 [Neobacillus niacini]|nr:hypothetical protein [Neobacillus niacini]